MLALAALLIPGCDRSQAPAELEQSAAPPATLNNPLSDFQKRLREDRSDTDFVAHPAAARLDPFADNLSQEQMDAARQEFDGLMEVGVDLVERLTETSKLARHSFDIDPDVYSTSMACLAAYKLAAEDGGVFPHRARVRMDQIVFVAFVSDSPPWQKAPVEKETLDGLRKRFYTDYLISLEGGRAWSLEDANWARRTVDICDQVFPEPESINLKVTPPPPPD